MKHTKPTMSWAMDQNHLNELLAKYWEREYNELRAEADAARKMIRMNEDSDSLEAFIVLSESIK